MDTKSNLDAFLNPRSVAVIGATERPGSWGSFIMEGLLSTDYSGKIYPVNNKADQIFGLPAVGDLKQVAGPVDLAVLTIPQPFVEEAVRDCAIKEVRGLILITAGYGEVLEKDKSKEAALAELARSHGMRLLGPNVSGTFNIHAGFNASAAPVEHLRPSPLAVICQGGFAIYDLLAAGFSRGMGVGKFIHTGNEADLTVTDFLEYFGKDPEVRAVLLYLETIRDGNRFLNVARDVAGSKPVVVYKAGRTPGSARAAQSHTGALSGREEVYQGLFHQAGIVNVPTMELLLPVGHALIERPPLRGPRVAIITVGGSWGVALSDAFEEAGLLVPELSSGLQGKLRSLGMPPRASTRNPVDFGASGLFLSVDTPPALAREILASGEVDALILHGIGRPGMNTDNISEEWRAFMEVEAEQIASLHKLEGETGLPVLIGSHFSPLESQVLSDLGKKGIRSYNKTIETAQLLSLMHLYWSRRLNGQ
ncbi:acetate--CoA ligase family protein [Thermodesulfobacteriota bacterium]